MRARRVWVGGLLAIASCYTGLPDPGADPSSDDQDGAIADTGGDDSVDGAGDDASVDDGDDGDGDGDDGGNGDGDGGGDGSGGDGVGSDTADGGDGSAGSDGADADDEGGVADGDDGDATGPDDGGPADTDGEAPSGTEGGESSDDGGASDDGVPGEDGVCGDGNQDAGEACDDGNADDTDTCSNGCEIQVPDDLPNNAYCNTVAGWSESWSDLEAQVLTLVNQKRAQVIDCGGGNVLGPSPPVTYDPALTCAARNHAKDMADNAFFSHTNLQGQGPSQRLTLAGYAWSTWGENIAAGYGTAQQVVDGWIDSQGHCVNLMNPDFTELGTGYYHLAGSEYGHYWTQNFGTPN